MLRKAKVSKKLLYGLLCAMMISTTALSSAGTNVNASRRRPIRTHRKAKRHYRHRIKRYRHKKVIVIKKHKIRHKLHYNQKIDINYSGHIYNRIHFYHMLHVYLVKDINKTRIAHHVRPLKDTSVIQRGANYRAPRVGYAYNHFNNYKKYTSNTGNESDAWVHGYFNHTSINNYLTKNDPNFNYCGENAEAFGPYFTNDSDGGNFRYKGTSPQVIAANMNDNFMNHDNAQGNHNGHRINELNPNYKDVGIGISFNNGSKIGGITEDFMG